MNIDKTGMAWFGVAIGDSISDSIGAVCPFAIITVHPSNQSISQLCHYEKGRKFYDALRPRRERCFTANKCVGSKCKSEGGQDRSNSDISNLLHSMLRKTSRTVQSFSIETARFQACNGQIVVGTDSMRRAVLGKYRQSIRQQGSIGRFFSRVADRFYDSRCGLSWQDELGIDGICT